MKAPMPQVNSQSASHEDVEESAATAHEFIEVQNDESVAPEVKKDSKIGGRKRRRAVSTGVLTPGAAE
jgi:ribonuclease E